MSWLLITLWWLALGARRGDALDCAASAIVDAPAYSSCQSTTTIDLATRRKTTRLDEHAFCSNSDCVSLWRLLEQSDALQCLDGYTTSNYTLTDPASARACFDTYSAPPQSLPATPTNIAVAAFQLSATTTTKASNGEESSRSGPSLESAVIGTADANSSTPGARSVPSGSTAAESDLQGTSRSAVYITLASCGGGVVLLVLLSAFIRRRKAQAMEAKILACLEQSSRGDYVSAARSSRSHPPAKNGSVGNSLVPQRRSKPSHKVVWLDDDIITAVRIPYAKLTLNSLVSRGGFGEVYRGMYRNKIVAIKRLLPEKRTDVGYIESFLDEIKLMASLEHEHIVRFIGVAWETIEELCVVSEFMALGDLRSLLAKYDLDEDAHPKGFTADKLRIALHVATAVTYMHSLAPVVLHRDIKSRNILLDGNLDAKVTDFGVSRERAESTMTTGVGSTLWMAPEVMAGGRYNEKADVFSFGVVLSELDTHSIPYAHVVDPGRGRRLPDTVIVQMMTLGRVSVEFTDEAASPMAQLGRRCVQVDPSKRPSAKEVEAFIHEQWSKVVVAL